MRLPSEGLALCRVLVVMLARKAEAWLVLGDTRAMRLAELDSRIIEAALPPPPPPPAPHALLPRTSSVQKQILNLMTVQVVVPSGAAMVLREPSKGGNTTSDWTQLKGSCSDGYSTSRTCEIQLSNATGTHFKSIMYLLDKCSRPLSAKQ